MKREYEYFDGKNIKIITASDAVQSESGWTWQYRYKDEFDFNYTLNAGPDTAI
ncbi:MAG: hypothetical protein JW795_05600 [Chitinivibrionales bacterium]|nr:hypothetical protein [Chitinivibrionales bacterium]